MLSVQTDPMSGFPVLMFSAKFKKWYVLISIDMYCVCIGIYPFILYGAAAPRAQGVCIGGYCKYWVCMYWFWVSLFSMRVVCKGTTRRSTVG